MAGPAFMPIASRSLPVSNGGGAAAAGGISSRAVFRNLKLVRSPWLLAQSSRCSSSYSGNVGRASRRFSFAFRISVA